MPKRPSVPSYRRHKQSGQAIVTLTDGFGGRRDVLLGTYGSPASRKEYDRVVAEWIANGRRLQVVVADDLSVNELAAAYWNHAKVYHGWKKNRGDYHNLKAVLRIVKALYGTWSARKFGPLALKACRQKMLEKDWARTYINRQVARLCQMFAWAAEEEMLPASVHEQLIRVKGLRRGKTEARESKKIRPVAQHHVDATVPFLQPTVAAMVRFQMLTGCRPEEVCKVRPLDFDMSNPACWIYRPGSDAGAEGEHKTAHHGHERLIFIGPKAQDVLRPFLGTKIDAYCFSPAASEARRMAQRRASRKTPLWPSHQKRRTGKPRRVANRYDTHAYRRAIARACRMADRKAHEKDATIPADEVVVPAWAPNRLRHSRATELRRLAGLDVAKTVLGHSRLETTQVYAEKDLAAAMELMAKIG
jgi:integrase